MAGTISIYGTHLAPVTDNAFDLGTATAKFRNAYIYGLTGTGLAYTATGLTLTDINVILSTDTGTKFGTSATQKLGFFDATPVVQQDATADLGVALSNLGLRAVGTAYPIVTIGTANFGGPLISSGAIIEKVVTVTDTYQALVTDETIVCNKATAFPVTLPAGSTGQRFAVKNIGSGNVTISTSGATIDGEASQVIYQYDCVQLQCVATNMWSII